MSFYVGARDEPTLPTPATDAALLCPYGTGLNMVFISVATDAALLCPYGTGGLGVLRFVGHYAHLSEQGVESVS
ncbi:hypothetical protein [Spirosoma utsteinense]|uniref:Uncharacterized protein n=1 Tax=Spirosoma utsteinense TaxID=2585773 RepID=A0ABR6WC60_9BACT|nr:hypothetical protein [Spirosoma utsteinense]MBC3788848.1 hypothetical protein [Spirosoma utsteinense]MBC3794117.1 hypothetical protein [Spirosoma utsteinense]